MLLASKICSNINVNGTRIGTDKLGHFFDEGYSLFTIARWNRKNVQDALKYGMSLEDGIYGAPMTSIKSYADLVANYEGFLFWTNLVDNNNPYFICDKNKWVQVRKFDWREYINDAWDEVVNCSSFTSAARAKAIKHNARELELHDFFQDHTIHRYQCPAKIGQCKKLSRKYGPWSSYLLGPECLR